MGFGSFFKKVTKPLKKVTDDWLGMDPTKTSGKIWDAVTVGTVGVPVSSAVNGAYSLGQGDIGGVLKNVAQGASAATPFMGVGGLSGMLLKEGASSLLGSALGNPQAGQQLVQQMAPPNIAQAYGLNSLFPQIDTNQSSQSSIYAPKMASNNEDYLKSLSLFDVQNSSSSPYEIPVSAPSFNPSVASSNSVYMNELPNLSGLLGNNSSVSDKEKEDELLRLLLSQNKPRQIQPIVTTPNLDSFVKGGSSYGF